METQTSKILASSILVLGLHACQTAPVDNADLNAARTTLTQLRSDPLAARAASVEIDRAQQSLQAAQASIASREGAEQVQHLSYLARRRAEIAIAAVTQARAQESVRLASVERERVQLQARTRAAQAQAQVSQASAQAAQATARTAQDEAAQQAQRAAALERDLQALQARNTQRGLVVTVGDVLFATGSAQLQPGALRSAQQIARVLEQYPERRVLVEGFTDSTGSEEANLALSQRRADAFRQALLQAGVPPQRVEVRAQGEGFPMADNTTAAGRLQNRRVEILFSNPQGSFAER